MIDPQFPGLNPSNYLNQIRISIIQRTSNQLPGLMVHSTIGRQHPRTSLQVRVNIVRLARHAPPIIFARSNRPFSVMRIPSALWSKLCYLISEITVPGVRFVFAHRCETET
jgi:hypothetical protein